MPDFLNYFFSHWQILFAVIVGASVSLYSFQIRRLMRAHRNEEYDKIFKQLLDVKSSLVSTKLAPIDNAAQQKRETFLNLPSICFHFAKKDEIMSLYNEYFNEPIIEQITQELGAETSDGIRGSVLKVLELKAGVKRRDKLTRTIKPPNLSVPEMLRRYQRATIENNLVAIGLELVDIDFSEVSKFEQTISELHGFGLTLDDQMVQDCLFQIRRKAAEKTILKLENANGLVVVEGKFKITNFSAAFYKCTYSHPINEYLTSTERKIVISATLKKESLEPDVAGSYAESVDRLISMKIFGRIWHPIDRTTNSWELQIAPIAVYS